ncbi:hypothetical protein AB0D32_29630 [Micromonospora sp. NPDC048170]|uniref:hypothetical protein n=1 Tax=Micromonospora sp. NPDC048170 TaxID=3154819 RepID=UPI003406BDFD
MKEVDRSIAIDIPVPGGMTEPARQRFAASVHEFSLALSRETSRLEEAERADIVNAAEITATMVVKANNEVRNPRQESDPPPSLLVVAAQLIAFIAAILAGVFGSYLNSRWQWSGLIGCATIGTITQGYAILTVRRRP